jgi:hypothetical protein
VHARVGDPAQAGNGLGGGVAHAAPVPFDGSVDLQQLLGGHRRTAVDARHLPLKVRHPRVAALAMPVCLRASVLLTFPSGVADLARGPLDSL